MKERSLNPEDYVDGPTWEDFERDAEAQDRAYDEMREKHGQPGADVNSFRGDNAPECQYKHDILDPKCKESFIELVERLRGLSSRKPY